MSICAIKNQRRKHFMQVIWNMGIHCTFDCSYCPDFRHSVTKPFAAKEKLYETVDFFTEYLNIMHAHTGDKTMYDINITGGEPTANPYLEEIAGYINSRMTGMDYEVSVTTNGFCPHEKMQRYAKTCFRSICFSYHAEQSPKQRELVLKNILWVNSILKDDDYLCDDLSVNIMMHEDPELFDDCNETIRYLEEHGVDPGEIRARTIDRDDKVQSKKRETTRIKNSQFGPKQGMKYTDAQLIKLKDVYVEKLGIDKDTKLAVDTWDTDKKEKTNASTVSGRACCGGVTLDTLSDGEWTPTKMLFDRNYKDWSCTVAQNWLNIEQDDDLVYTHQTCRANFDHEKGPLGTISESHKILDYVRSVYSSGQVPTIKCPNYKCNCGICTPKSSSEKHFNDMVDSQFPGMTPLFKGL